MTDRTGVRSDRDGPTPRTPRTSTLQGAIPRPPGPSPTREPTGAGDGPETDFGAVVLGLGNPLLGDDGVGIAALERLGREWRVPPGVELVDGGTWGLSLLPTVESTRRLLIVDAIDLGGDPGTLHRLDGAELPAWLDHKISPHEVGLRDLLAVARFRDGLPEETCAIGLQPERLEMGRGLSPVVRARLDALVDEIVDRLRSWGLEVRPCTR